MVLTVTCGPLNADPETVICRPAFILENFKWYSSVLLLFDDAEPTSGNIINWPPNREVLDSLMTIVSGIAGRSWTRWEVI